MEIKVKIVKLCVKWVWEPYISVTKVGVCIDFRGGQVHLRRFLWYKWVDFVNGRWKANVSRTNVEDGGVATSPSTAVKLANSNQQS